MSVFITIVTTDTGGWIIRFAPHEDNWRIWIQVTNDKFQEDFVVHVRPTDREVEFTLEHIGHIRSGSYQIYVILTSCECESPEFWRETAHINWVVP